MRIAVIGAAGRTGREVVDAALARGWRVSALVRSAPEPALPAEVDVVQGDARDRTSVAAAVAGADAVVSALGSHGGALGDLYAQGAAAIVDSIPSARVTRVVAVSTRSLGDTASAGDEGSAPQATNSAVLADLAEMERVLRASELAWTIMRPARLVDGPLGEYDARVGAVFEAGRETRRADLADAMLRAIAEGLWVRSDVAIVSSGHAAPRQLPPEPA